MNRIFGIVGYACNGKSTILKELAYKNKYLYVDLPKIYLDLAIKNGYSGVTEWFSSVGLEKYKKESSEAVIKYIKQEMPKNKDLLIDDIFDEDVYNFIIKIFPQTYLIAIHSYFETRARRLGIRRNIDDIESMRIGIKIRDEMKNYCGIQNVLSKCDKHIENTSGRKNIYYKLDTEINKSMIICIFGYSGSGKSTINEYLAQQFSIPLFKYGKQIADIMTREGYQKSRDYVLKNGIKKYIKKTNREMKKRLIEFSKHNRFFLIDGLVSYSLYNYLCSKHDVKSIVIKVDENVRYERIGNRENIKTAEGQNESSIKDSIKISNGLDIIMSTCKNVVDGNQPLETVLKNIVKILNFEN